jgi:Curli production assembly/transport component CsgG
MRIIMFSVLLLLLSSNNMLFAQGKISLAVLDLDAEGISESEGRIISERLRSSLFESGKYIVLERDKMDEILKEQGFQQSGCTSDECVVEIGKLIGMQQMVAGSIGKIGNLYTFNVRMIDVQSGRVLHTAVDDCACPIEEVLTTSTDTIVRMLIDGKNTPPKNQKDQKSHFYFSPFLGYGWDTTTKLGYGGKAGYQNADGFIFGIVYLKNTGTDESSSADDYEEWKYGDSWFAGGEFGYIFKTEPVNILLSIMAGVYELNREEYYEDYNSGEVDESYTYGDGLSFGINLGVTYAVTQYFAIGADIKGIMGKDGDGFLSPYATFNFYF